MSMLRNIEEKLEGLFEGMFSRTLKSHVEVVEIARKLAREMEENKTVSVSRVFVPNEYRVYLSPDDREQFAGYEDSLRQELSGYLVEHAREHGLSLLSKPIVEVLTDAQLRLGEFGIQAKTVNPPSQKERVEKRPRGHAPSAPTSQQSKRRPEVAGRKAFLVTENARWLVEAPNATIGRSGECDLVIKDPNASRRHAELVRSDDSWYIKDLQSTNGITVNGRAVDSKRLKPGDSITIGSTIVLFEVD